MDSATENSFLEKLEEFVYDEDKIVTYTWLSTNLGIKVHEAEVLLEKYVRKIRQTKPNDLSITYILVGIKNDDNISITLSKECDLEENRTAFNCVTSQHMYSVRKSKDTNESVLFLVEALNAHNLREKPVLGSIVGKNCVKRVLKPKSATAPEKVASAKNILFNINKNAQSTSEVDNKSNQKQNGIASFFTKTQSEGDVKDKKIINKTTKTKPNGIMGNFLAKVPVKTNTERDMCDKSEAKVDVETIKDDVSKVIEESKVNKTIKDDVKGSELKIENAKAVDESKVNKKESKKSKRPRKDNKSEQAQKKRKRIIERHDSDSDDIFGDDDGENPEFEENGGRKRRLSSADEIGNITDEESTPIYQQPSKPVNKKRKQVMRTFTDEDGYMITKNEWVLEDEPGDEEKENSQNKVHDIEIVENSTTSLKNSTKTSTKDEAEKQASEMRKNSAEELPSKVTKKKSGKQISKNQQTLLNFFKKN